MFLVDKLFIGLLIEIFESELRVQKLPEIELKINLKDYVHVDSEILCGIRFLLYSINFGILPSKKNQAPLYLYYY